MYITYIYMYIYMYLSHVNILEYIAKLTVGSKEFCGTGIITKMYICIIYQYIYKHFINWSSM